MFSKRLPTALLVEVRQNVEESICECKERQCQLIMSRVNLLGCVRFTVQTAILETLQCAHGPLQPVL